METPPVAGAGLLPSSRNCCDRMGGEAGHRDWDE